MNEVAKALERAEACVALLGQALEAAKEANAAWWGIDENIYSQLVSEDGVSRILDEAWMSTAHNAITLTRRRKFPDLPGDIIDWVWQAMEAGVKLTDVPRWFAELVGPTAEEEI